MLGSERVINPDKVAVYIRWSTDEQGQGTTLEVQREACEHYCLSQGWRFSPDLVFIDDGYSGGTLDRPALTTLRAAVKAGQVECVVVYKLDRLSRNLLDCVSLVRQEWGTRCALYSTKEHFDTTSSVGQMVFNILVSFAEFERNVIRDRTLSGKHKRAQQGRNAGQIYPYGYKKGDSTGQWALDGWDTEQKCLTGPAAVARRIFDDFLSGKGMPTISLELEKEGIPAPKGGLWRNGTIACLLDNPIYAGQYVYGRTDVTAGSADQPKFVVPGAAPAIITQEEFEAVQNLRRARAFKSPRRLASVYLLSGIARCGKCGATMNGTMGSGQQRYYACVNHTKRRECDCGVIDANKVDSHILEAVKSKFSSEASEGYVSELEASIRRRIQEATHALNLAEEARNAAERKQARVEDEFFAGRLDGRAYSQLLAKLESEQANTARSLQAAQDQLDKARSNMVDVDGLKALSRRVDAWAYLSIEELKQLLREVVAEVTLYQQKAPVGGARKRGNLNPLLMEWRPRIDTFISQPGDNRSHGAETESIG